MTARPLTSDDEALIAAAQDALQRLYRPGWHHIGAAVRLRSWRIVIAVHLEAIAEGERDFEAIVAVRHPHAGKADQAIRVVAAGGRCRKLISDYGLETQVIYADGGTIHKRPVGDLLPAKYARGDR